jgi:hypothetical protein
MPQYTLDAAAAENLPHNSQETALGRARSHAEPSLEKEVAP